MDGRFQVLIAPGTSVKEKDKAIFPGDILIGNERTEIQALKLAGLVKVTKFQLDERHRVWLPYNSDFFEIAPGSKTPCQGKLDFGVSSIKTKVEAAKRAVGWTKLYPP